MEDIPADRGKKPQKKGKALCSKKSKKLKKAGPRLRSQSPPPLPTAAGACMLGLPTEIVLLIAELLDVKDQVSLSRVARFFYGVVDPLLYENNVRSGDSSCLFWAAEHGQLGTIKKAHAAGANLNQFGPGDSGTRDRTLLPQPDSNDAESGDEDADGDDATSAPPPRKLSKYGTPLHAAAVSGHRDIVAYLLDHGVDIDAPSFKMCDCRSVKAHQQLLHTTHEFPRWRALHLAMCYGEREVAELLVFRGASLSLDAIPGRHHTALHSAAAKGLIPVVKLLAMEPNFDVNEPDSADNNALHYVSELFGPRESPAIRDTITKLLALGAELEAHNESGHTPLLNACCRGNYAVALRLVSIGANPDPHRFIPNFRDYRPLYYSILPRAEFFDLNNAPVKHDDFEGLRVSLIKSLVDAGADVEARFDKRGHRSVTTLMLACELAEPRAIEALLEAGAHANSVDRSGKPSLLYACSVRVDHRGEVPEIASLLIRRGAFIDLEEPSATHASALDWAAKHCRWGDGEVLNAMLRVAGRRNVGPARLKAVLRKCASVGNYKALGVLLKFARTLFGIDADELKGLMDLTIDQREPCNQKEVFQCLVGFGYHVDSNEILLLKTMMKKNELLALEVIRRGVSVSDVRLFGGQTFLHLACEWGNMSVVKALLERAADVDAFDDELKTPLSIAVSRNHLELALALMTEVADPHLVPPDPVLERLYEDDDERRLVKRRYLTPFDLTIRDTRIEILNEMLSRYALPEISPGTPLSYVHRASRNPSTLPLEALLAHGADPHGGKDCPSPPVVGLLRHMWANPSPPDLALSMCQSAKLLVTKDSYALPSVAAVIDTIYGYDGPDADRAILARLIRQELGPILAPAGPEAPPHASHCDQGLGERP